jgi:dinuclear metal center YbgI/SA1388 family protein
VADRDEIIAFCDELLDAQSFEDWCWNGLQVPGIEEVSAIATGVSANLEFLARATEGGAQLALVHHGLFWESQSQRLSEAMAERLRLCLDSGLSVGGYHLPLDAHRAIGNNAMLCDALGFELQDRPFGETRGKTIGAIGHSAEGIKAAELTRRIGEELAREPLVFDAGPELVRSIGIVSGGGGSAMHEAISLGLDAFLTGEPAEPAMAEAREAGIHFIAAGHYATETLGIRRLGELLAGQFNVAHDFIDVPNPV